MRGSFPFAPSWLGAGTGVLSRGAASLSGGSAAAVREGGRGWPRKQNAPIKGDSEEIIGAVGPDFLKESPYSRSGQFVRAGLFAYHTHP